MTEYIMVLDDGETYSGLEQCHIIEIDADTFDPGVDDEIDLRLDALMRSDRLDVPGLRIIQAFAGPESVLDNDLKAALGIVVEAARDRLDELGVNWSDYDDEGEAARQEIERIEWSIQRIADFRRDTDPNI